MNKQSIWREGRYLDLWSLNHVLFGFLSGYVLIELFHLSLGISCLMALAAYVAWELFELMIRAGEYPANQVMDVVVSLVGFGVFVLVNGHSVSIAYHFVAPTLVCFIILEVFGYYSKFKFRNAKSE